MSQILLFYKGLKPIFKTYLFTLLALIIIQWQFNGLYTELIHSYIKFLTNIAGYIAGLLTHDISFTQSEIIQENSVLQIDSMFLSLKSFLFVLAIVVYWAVRQNKTHTIFWFIGWAIGINIIRITVAALIFFKTGNFNNLASHSSYMFLLWSFPLAQFLFSTYTNLKIKNSQVGSLLYRLTTAMTLYFLIRSVYQHITGDNNIFADILANIILNIAKISLSFIGFTTQLADRHIFNDYVNIFMGTACIGMEVMLVFILILFLEKTYTTKKIIFSAIGLLVILLLNALRVVLLFVFVLERGNDHLAVTKQHNIFNIGIYSCIGILWYLWFFYYTQPSKK